MADDDIRHTSPVKGKVPICAIGASAGGVAALQSFFRQIPEDLGLAYVIIVHLAPEHPSAMADILQNCTNMQVLEVDDTPRLKPDCVYVIPPDRELVIEGDDITARPFTEPRGQRAPVDMFFRSVAAARGDGMAVVLTGAGADGALGVRAIQEGGGVVFVQDPSEAEFPMMPQNAIATGAANFVAPIAHLVQRIAEVARSKEAVQSIDLDGAIEELHRIVNFLRARTGHDFSSYKRATVMRRVLRRMQVSRSESLKQYSEYLRNSPEEAQDLFSDLLISVTMFFRDRDAFEKLADLGIRPMFDDVGEDGIRGWVAGCATGEEAYSIAILILEEAARRKVRPVIQIFASDLDEGALATARVGRYPRSIEADVSDERLRRFFVDEGTHYRIRAEVRDVVLFASHSVLKDPPFMRLDLITCRNLMIYLERSLQQQIAALFHYGLKPQGVLFLGSAETVDAPDLFVPLDRDARLYRARAKAARHLPLLPQLPAGHHPAPRPRHAEGQETNARLSIEAHADALEHAAPPSVLVDEAHHVVHLSPSAGEFILHSAGTISGRLSSVVRPELRLDLGLALDRALEHGLATTTHSIPVNFKGRTRNVSMRIEPASTGSASPPHALVFFLDDGAIEPGDEVDTEQEAPGGIRQMRTELRAAREALAARRSGHESTVEDLRAANEELQSINEEYRSTAEELETSKEELQSMNEELQTVNAELKVKLDSISTAHSDLQNLTAATEIGTLFLDTKLRIRMFTPPVAELFNITEQDIGRLITDFTHRLACDGVEERAREVMRELAPLETEVKSRDGRWFMMRLRPYRTIEDRINGIVLTFVDITSRIEAERHLSESEERYRTLFNSIDDGFCVVQMIFDGDKPVDYRFLEVNAAFERQTGLADATGKRMRELVPDHEEHWYENYGRVATTQKPERFEAPAASLDRFYEVYAFPYGAAEEHRVGILFKDVSERKEAEEQRELLTHELSHRVKNTLAIVQSLARQSGTHQRSIEEYRDQFIGRLHALSRAHGQLLETRWRSADLGRLVNETLAAYEALDAHRLLVQGEAVTLTPKQALGLALILHELATNASKYGSLSHDGGNLSVTWRVEHDQAAPGVVLEWRERGGPKIAPPTREGFGTVLVQRAASYELKGAAELDYSAEGLICTIRFPLE